MLSLADKKRWKINDLNNQHMILENNKPLPLKGEGGSNLQKVKINELEHIF